MDSAHPEHLAPAQTGQRAEDAPSCQPSANGGAWPAFREYPVERWRGGQAELVQDPVIEEVPVALVYNGQPHVVMMASPQDLEDFALGFSLTEGIVANPGEIAYIQVYHRREGIEVCIRIPDTGIASRLAARERNLTGRTGCGLCGTANLSEAVRPTAPVERRLTVSEHDLRQALQAMAEHQPLNRISGAVHAAAWVVQGQGIGPVREDVGRHNALDKLIGVLARTGANLDEGFVLVTSRASYEMVQKCASAGIGFMAAISGPTGLAIRLAEETGLTLVGFARSNGHVVYANPHRLIHSS
ncbi:MAG: formate dehydrogenase accessory sulfurtransferase FdhD [Methylococcaceae bacterium]|nr:formate dehydrogenase accessory sulfurtransferase FdhD [Methylococcaceae bacterium]